MNYIIQTHFGASEGCAPSLETALDRLGAWLEELSQMHLEPWSGETELRDLLEDALGALELNRSGFRGSSAPRRPPTVLATSTNQPAVALR